ncbi:rhomboid-related protein 2-like isoform X2 [Procambarus clarkii]|uniref:rhomboid-related protein 2 isoform X2 n=1 Tax=Procambarus clarkii TaxID=6728 RepID=UPI001E677990|nr:rhomboid-related protein 2-like isoform X2 [Procambarus clarkii]
MSVQPFNMAASYDPVKRLDVAEEFWSRQDPDRTRRIPLAMVRDRILLTKEADGIPNALVVQLLRQADNNSDGYLDYEEYMRFAEASAEHSRSREVFNKAALSVVPRGERTADRRNYLQEYKCCPPALFMVTATLVEIVVFIYYAVDMNKPIGPSGPAPLYSPLIYNPYRRYEAWRYLTYALIHSGYVHLVLNLVMQMVLGLLLELVHGWWRVGVIYLSGVLAGSLAQSITQPTVYLAGASGGVYAITYAHVGNLLLNWSEMEFRWLQLIVCLLVTVLDVSYALWDSYGSPTPSNTGHMAHLAGAIAGVLMGINILMNLKKRRWERICWWVALFLYVALVITAVILNAALPVPDYFPDNDYTDLVVVRENYLNSLL